jgi:hypothetical protein
MVWRALRPEAMAGMLPGPARLRAQDSLPAVVALPPALPQVQTESMVLVPALAALLPAPALVRA